MLRYLKKMEVEPKHVEIARRFLADGAKEYNNEKSVYSLFKRVLVKQHFTKKNLNRENRKIQ